MFHGPALVYGILDDGTPVALENTTIKNVHWVIRTSYGGIIVEKDPIHKAVAHDEGQTGSFVILAVEMYAGPKGNNKIIVSGTAPYGDYRLLITPLYQGIQLDGIQFMHNMMDWAKTVEETTKPNIVSIVRTPMNETNEDDVTIAVSVTDNTKVKQVTLSHNATCSWENITMEFNGTYYVAVIPNQTAGTIVSYKIYAEDVAGNWAESQIYSYTVTASTSPEKLFSMGDTTLKNQVKNVLYLLNLTWKINLLLKKILKAVLLMLSNYFIINFGLSIHSLLHFGHFVGLRFFSLPNTYPHFLQTALYNTNFRPLNCLFTVFAICCKSSIICFLLRSPNT